MSDDLGILGAPARWRDAAAVYLERRLIVVFAMGFASGLPLALSAGTLAIWLTEAGVSLTAVGLFAAVGTPYSVKFFWAPLIDRPEEAPLVTAGCALLVAFRSASQDIVIDAYRIEILTPEQQGAGAAATQAGYRMGMIMSGAGALYLADSGLDWSIVYALMAVLLVAGLIVALMAPEPEAAAVPPGRDFAGRLKDMVVDPFTEFFARNGVRAALLVLVFILLYKLGDAFAGVMANPFYVKIGFTKTEIATVSKIFGTVATLGGVFVGGVMVARFGVLWSLFGCGVLQMLSNLMFAAQAAVGAEVGFLVLTIGIENLSGGMGSAAFVAYLSLLCNTAYTGTQYALFSSFMAVGRTWLSASSGYVADQTDWVTFFILSTVIALPGVVMAVWMTKRLPMADQAARDLGGR
jgi:PAT family beta-lactamase induction signal transducer AmpG